MIDAPYSGFSPVVGSSYAVDGGDLHRTVGAPHLSGATLQCLPIDANAHQPVLARLLASETVEPEPVLTGAGKDRSGLMGAVRAAFKSGPKDHDHQFIEAPGGIGITRYVCEECGYVSISA